MQDTAKNKIKKYLILLHFNLFLQQKRQFQFIGLLHKSIPTVVTFKAYL